MSMHFLTRRVEKHVVAVLLLLGLLGAWSQAQSVTTVMIMHTNDLHGQVLPRNGVGGIAEIATLIKAARPDLILDAGDMFTGTLVNDEFKGLPIIEAMSRIGYHAAAMGNHEFDYGVDALAMRAREAKFPILTANIDSKIPEIRKYTILPVKGIRFGIIGLTTEETRTTTHPKNLGSVTISDVVSSVRQILPEVRSRSDVIIVISHMGRAEERLLAAAFPEIRLMIGGHEHETIGSIQIDQTTVVKTGSSGRNLGRVTLRIQDKKVKEIESRLIAVTSVVPDPDVARIIQPYEAKVAQKMSLVLGEATGDLNRSSNSESALSNLVADAFREKTKTQIVFQNLGGIRSNIPKGTITWGRAFEVLPFQNTLITLEMTGAQVKQVLARALGAVSGLRVRLDLTKPVGQKLISATFPDGSPLDDSRTYTVTTNDFVLAGGDGFVEFAQGKNIKDTAIFQRDVLVEYLQAHPRISPNVDGRVRVN